MYTRHSLTPLAAALAMAATVLFTPAAHAQVAKVNGVEIPQARLDMILKVRAANKQPDSPEVRNALRDTLINQEVVVQEAMKKEIGRAHV